MEVGQVKCGITNMALDQVKINIDNTKITPIDTTSAFDLKVQNLGLNFMFQYDMFSDSLLEDHGVGRAVFDDVNLNVDLSLYLNKQRVKFNVDKVNINISELNLILQGG